MNVITPSCINHIYRIISLKLISWFGRAGFTVGDSHISPSPHGDCCSDIEVCGEMDVATRVCSSCGSLWQIGRWCYGQGCVDRWIEGAVPVVSPIEDVGWFGPLGWHGDGPRAHNELQRFLFPWQDLEGAVVGGLQSLAPCVLTEEDVGALLQVAAHECSWEGMACCWY
jgi:hypothetical protein